MEIKKQKSLTIIVGGIMFVSGVPLPIIIVAVMILWWIMQQTT